MINKEGYEVKKQAIPKDLAEFLYNYLIMKRNVSAIMYRDGYVQYPHGAIGDWEDSQMPNTFSQYSDIAMETLLKQMHPVVENIIGKKINSTYSYCRVYKYDDELVPHKDRPECEFSTTLFLGGDEWEIYMEGNPILLKQGDMCVYKGCELEHWRKPFKGRRCVQVFLHYNLANKINKKYDGREILGLPVEYTYDTYTKKD
tara:strand:- start:29 stop:631 length:603 start_codon:yes stop_codon:yes gene_type:complete